MSDRIILGPDGRKYITNEPLLHEDKQAAELRRLRKPLSLDEIQHCADEAGLLVTKRLRCFARAIEAKLKEKNNGS